MSEPDPEPVEYESPYPECRLTVTTDPAASVRLDMSHKRAALLAKRIRNTVKSHDGDGLIDIRFVMSERAYRRLSETLHLLLDTDADTVSVQTSPEPALSVMVLLSERQIRNLDSTTDRDLERAENPLETVDAPGGGGGD